jgi:hypothetical protein
MSFTRPRFGSLSVFTTTTVANALGCSRAARYAARVIPWIIFALVVVPVLVVGFVVTRRRTVAGERPANEAEAELAEQEFEEAEAYQAKWQEEDKARYHQERLP